MLTARSTCTWGHLVFLDLQLHFVTDLKKPHFCYKIILLLHQEDHFATASRGSCIQHSYPFRNACVPILLV